MTRPRKSKTNVHNEHVNSDLKDHEPVIGAIEGARLGHQTKTEDAKPGPVG